MTKTLRKLKRILEFIAAGHTIPEAVEPRDDERIEMALTIIRSAQIKAKQGLALLDAALKDEKPKRKLSKKRGEAK